MAKAKEQLEEEPKKTAGGGTKAQPAKTTTGKSAPKSPAKPVKEEPEVAKAGKRSAKAIKEDAQKQAKEQQKTSLEADKSKPAAKPPRSRAERASRKYREVAKLIEKGKVYDVPEAMALISKTTTTKFDSTVELHVNLGVDPKQADQNIRATVGLPSGTGKTVRVAVFCETDDAAKATKAGADIAGLDAILPALEKEKINFDVLISTPKLMPQLGKYARLLGPRGLMPNPKSGTVAADVVSATKEAKAGKIEYRVDPAGIIHLGIGKVSFGPEKLIANFEAVMDSLRQNKPASLKGIYLQKITLTTTMGPAVRVKA